MPSTPESELMAISALVNEPRTTLEIFTENDITDEYFTLKIYQDIRSIVSEMVDNEYDIDIEGLTSNLKKRKYERQGIASTLFDVYEHIALATNLKFHLDNLKLYYYKRQAIESGLELIKKGKESIKFADFDVTTERMAAQGIGIYTIGNISNDIDSLYDNKLESISTGWESLDRYYNIAQKHVTIVTGIPSHGKSTWIDALTVNLANNQGWKFAIFSPENQPISQHASQIAKCYLGKQFFDGYANRMTREELQSAKRWMKDRYYFILPPDDSLTVDHILEKTEVIISRYGINGLIIDPWNELDHSRKVQYTETEYISSALTKIRRFARKFNVHIWVIAHPTKMQRQANGNYAVPTPYDIAGSANFRNKPDNCICVWRDLTDESKAVEIHIQKVRFRHLGKVGKVQLYFDIGSGRYC